MMKKIKSTIDTIVNDLENFYEEKIWSFLTLNGVKIDTDTTQIQWIFSKYKAIDEVVIFYIEIRKEQIIPSIIHIIPSAIISQREIVDMFGIAVEDSSKGLYLDEDSEQMPLSTCGI